MATTPELPTFRSPPLDEVYCSLVFEPLKNLRLHHVGLLRSRFEDRYPKVEYATRIADIQPEVLNPGRLGVSRVWFVATSDDVLVQFQEDRLIFNWRKRPEAGEYRRFPSVIRGFNDALDTLHEFVEDQDLGPIEPKQCELGYINVIPKGEGWDGGSRLDRLFPDLRWRATKGRYLPRPVSCLWQTVFPLPDGFGQLIAKLQPTKRNVDQLDVLRFEPGPWA